jgi:hypothetical protein
VREALKSEIRLKNAEIERINGILMAYNLAFEESVAREQKLSDANRKLWSVLQELQFA